MADRLIGVADEAAGAGVAEYHTRDRTIGANTASEQYVLYVTERVPSFKGMVTTFRTLGNAATPQNLFSIENQAGSSVIVAVRRLSVQHDVATGPVGAPGMVFSVSRPASLPSGGTPLTKVGFDSSLASSASVVARGATASDGGAATAITATAGSRAYRQWQPHDVSTTRAGQHWYDDERLVPRLAGDDPVLLAAGESLLVHVDATLAADNSATAANTIVNCMWDEVTFP